MNDNALYLEVDEDITSAIDKLGKAPAGDVQIVVPKRSTMLQSIINLKLLKKAADQSGKKLVLVTGDRIASELAARVGLAVAPSIGAAPVMSAPSIPEALKNNEEIIDGEYDEDMPAGNAEAAPAAAAKINPLKKLVVNRMPVSDGPPPSPERAAEASASAGAKRAVKVPNFNRLQRRLLWAGLAVFLIGGYMLAMYLFTSAKITLYAAGIKVGIDTSFSADTSGSTDLAKSVLAAQTVTVAKDLSGPFVPSGKKDVGTKAGGTMTVYNEYDTSPHALVAGTRFQAPDGKIFRTKADGSVPGATLGSVFPFTPTAGKSDPIPVEADQSGDGYNEAPARYTIPGYSGTMAAKIYGQGIQMSGGTTKTVSIVTQSDVDTEQAALLDKDKDNAARDLAGRLPTGYTAVDGSQTTSVAASPSPAVDAEGSTGTLALKVTYTVLTVKKSEYEALINSQEQKQVGTANQIYDNGMSGAQITASGKDSAGRPTFHFTTDAYSGAKIDKTALAKKLAGNRFGDASNTATGLPGVRRADISIWPGWVSKLPSRPDKISITIQVAASK
ncbi:MAG: hypothetical protein NVSMB39_6100 [Candidatus Saccharimonadales bacterium]